jgi:hypothetical protein
VRGMAGRGDRNTVMTPGLSKNGLTVGAVYGYSDTALNEGVVTAWSGACVG